MGGMGFIHLAQNSRHNPNFIKTIALVDSITTATVRIAHFRYLPSDIDKLFYKYQKIHAFLA
jgi:hypothetical protein